MASPTLGLIACLLADACILHRQYVTDKNDNNRLQMDFGRRGRFKMDPPMQVYRLHGQVLCIILEILQSTWDLISIKSDLKWKSQYSEGYIQG